MFQADSIIDKMSNEGEEPAVAAAEEATEAEAAASGKIIPLTRVWLKDNEAIGSLVFSKF